MKAVTVLSGSSTELVPAALLPACGDVVRVSVTSRP